MTAADFVVQYAMVVLFTLAAAHRDLFPWVPNGNIERVIREQERYNDAFEAKIWLARM